MNSTYVQPDRPAIRTYRLAALMFLAAFVGIRVAGMLNDPLLEDHDSAGYLDKIGVFATFEADRIYTLSPDLLPLYPLTSAIVHALGVPSEAAARSVSLASSVMAAALIVLVAVRLESWAAGAIAAMFMAFEPVLARLSYSILTEPLYTSLLALGLWQMIRLARAPPTVRGALALGVIFGFSFLCRFEGILFLAGIPLLQWCLTLFWAGEGRRRHLQPLAVWTAVFAAAYAVIAAPQVLFVSDKMNQFALNGREAWSIIINAREDRSEEVMLRGLDYSPTVTNLDYLQQSPDDLDQIASAVALTARAKRFIGNLDTLQRQSLPQLLALPLLAFAPLGLLLLLRTRRFAEALILVWFIGMAFAAPLMYKTIPAYILASVPPLIVLAALGVIGAAREVAQLAESQRWRQCLVPSFLLAMTMLTVAANARPVWTMITDPDRINPMADPYSDPVHFAPFLPVLQSACASNPGEVVLARKRYVTTLAGCPYLVMPYATLDQLRVYALANRATLLFVDSRWDSDRPLYADLVGVSSPPAGFELLLRQEHPDGQRLLYRLHLDGKTAGDPTVTRGTPTAVPNISRAAQ